MPNNLAGKFFKYIGKFGHVATNLYQGLLPHVPPQRPSWEGGCDLTVHKKGTNVI